MKNDPVLHERRGRFESLPSGYFAAACLARVLIALAERRMRFPSTTLVCRFTANVRLVAILEWLLEFPARVPRPVIWHTRLIVGVLRYYRGYGIMGIGLWQGHVFADRRAGLADVRYFRFTLFTP